MYQRGVLHHRIKIISCQQAYAKFEFAPHNLLTYIIDKLFYITLIKKSFKSVVRWPAVCDCGI